LRAGEHRFEVHGTDRAGNRDPNSAVVAWTIGGVAGDVTADPKPLKILGPKLLQARDLLTRNVHPVTERMRLVSGDEFETESGRREPGSDDCQASVCRPDAGPQVNPVVTPPLSFGPFLVNTTRNDPQIAASRTHLIVTNGTVALLH